MRQDVKKHADYLRAISKPPSPFNVNHIADFIEKEYGSFTDAAIVGFVYSYLCNEADKGNDIRQIELPRIYKAWQQANEWIMRDYNPKKPI